MEVDPETETEGDCADEEKDRESLGDRGGQWEGKTKKRGTPQRQRPVEAPDRDTGSGAGGGRVRERPVGR